MGSNTRPKMAAEFGLGHLSVSFKRAVGKEAFTKDRQPLGLANICGIHSMDQYLDFGTHNNLINDNRCVFRYLQLGKF